jgi:MFS family permease
VNPWRGLGSLPREIWVLFATTLINRAGTMALPFLVLYLTKNLGVSAGDAGLVLAFYGVGALVTSPVAGHLCDRVGAVRIMTLSLVASGALLLLFPLAHSYGLILALALAWAVISEAFRPASLAIITDLVAPEQRKSAFALSRLAVNIGMSIGPAAGGFIAVASFHALFYIDGATSILAGLMMAAAFGARGTPGKRGGAAPATATGLPLGETSVLKDRRLLYFLVALIPVEIVFFQTQAAMPLFLVRDLGLSEATYGILFAINTVMVILIEVPLNSAMSDWPHRRALALGALLCGVGFGALAVATNVAGVAVTIVVWSFGEMVLLPGASAYVADIAPAERRGVYMGFFQMTFSLAFAVGPWVGTLVMERWGAPSLWAATFVASCVSAAMMWRLSSEAQQYEKSGASA